MASHYTTRATLGRCLAAAALSCLMVLLGAPRTAHGAFAGREIPSLGRFYLGYTAELDKHSRAHMTHSVGNIDSSSGARSMTFPSSNEQVWNPDWAQPTTNVTLLQDGRYHPNLVGAWTSAVDSSERARLAPVADGVPNQWFHDHDDRPVLAKNLGCSLVGNCPCADIHMCSSSSSTP